LPQSLLDQLPTYTGTALIGPRSNAKTAEFAIPVPLPPNLPGLNATVSLVESLPQDSTVALARGGAFAHWFEHLETDTASETTTTGQPAIASAGKLHYLAGWPDDAAFDRIIASACAREGIETQALPEGLRCRDTQTHRVWFNYNPEAVTFQGLTHPAAGVTWQSR
jgi:beta-galactosidase